MPENNEAVHLRVVHTLAAHLLVYLDPITKFYVITRYEDVRNALLKPDLYLSDAWMETVQDEVQVRRARRAGG